MRDCPNMLCQGGAPLVLLPGQVMCEACGVAGPYMESDEEAIASWDELPRATRQGRRDWLYQRVHDEYFQNEGTTYASLAEKYGKNVSTIHRWIKLHRAEKGAR